MLTTGSDADSSGDGKVVANSIDGEDELVDVAMKDSNENSTIAGNNSAENNAMTEAEKPVYVPPLPIC